METVNQLFSEPRTNYSLNLQFHPLNNINPVSKTGSIEISLTEHYRLFMTERSSDGGAAETTSRVIQFQNRTLSRLLSDNVQNLSLPNMTTQHIHNMLCSMNVHPNCYDSVINHLVPFAVGAALNAFHATTDGGNSFRIVANLDAVIEEELLANDDELIDLAVTQSMEEVDDDEFIDLVVTQSMEEYDGRRRARASKSAIDGLSRENYYETPDCLRKICVVCMEDFSVGSEVTRMPCSHIFHGECLVRWLTESNSCPICRHGIGL